MKGFLIAMSSAWGLFQIIIFLGYGVVSVPKQCLKMSDIKSQYEYAMFRVTVCEEHLQNSKIELEDIVQIALTIKDQTYEGENRKIFEEILA